MVGGLALVLLGMVLGFLLGWWKSPEDAGRCAQCGVWCAKHGDE